MSLKGYKTMGGAIQAAHKMRIPVIAVWQHRPEEEGPHAGRWNWAAEGSQWDRYAQESNVAVAGSRWVVTIAAS